MDFQTLMKIEFLKFWSFINLPWGHWGPIQIFSPIGSAVLTFIGYKQTDKQSIYIYRYIVSMERGLLVNTPVVDNSSGVDDKSPCV